MLTTKRFVLPLVFFLFCSFSLFSQDEIPAMKWGEYKGEDIRLKTWAADTSAAAVVLGNVGSIYMDEVRGYYGFLFTEHKRIKILTKAGFDYANVTIPFYSKDETQLIDKIRAQTVAPDGYKHAVDVKSIVYEKLSDRWSVAKFTFPKVTEGCILEYEYDLSSKQLLELREWYFQEKIPTRFSVLNLDIFSRYEYTYLFQGADKLKSTKPAYRDNRTKVTFHVNDLPGLKEESFVTSIENHLTRLKFQLSKYWSLQGAKIEVLSTWEKTAEELLAKDNLGSKFLKKNNYNKVLEAAKNVYNPTDSTRAKVQKLYDWVNENITWNGYYGLWTDKVPNDVWQNRKGNSSDINFLLLAMLIESGVTAHPVLISTRKNGVPYMPFPIIDQFNHVLIYVEFENKQTMLIDAGNPNLGLGLLREESYNGQGWVMKKKDPVWVNIKAPVSSQILSAKFDITKEGNLVGSINTIYRGQMAAEQRNAYQKDTSGKVKAAFLHKKNADWQIESVSTTNLEKINEPLRETIKCTILNTGEVNDDLIYIKPTLKSGWEVNPFKQETRTYPIEFPSPTNDHYTLSLNIPTGYKVEELPKPLTLNLPPEDARFIYTISADDKAIKLTANVQINKTFFAEKDYAVVRNFFSQVSAKLEEMIVLKKGKL